MLQTASVFQLKVLRIETSCLFELSWGQGQQLNVTLPYPEALDSLYQEWQADYLGFYQTALRGRVVENGTIAPPPVDWHAELVQSQAKLLSEFHNWLRRGELFDIRSCLAQAARDGGMGTENWGLNRENSSSLNCQSSIPTVEVFLTCDPIDLARLPWEAWEIGTEFAAVGKIRIVRTPPNRQQFTKTQNKQRHRPRILAILGDETGLDFAADKEALRSLSKIADIEFVGWQGKEHDIGELKAEIIEKIADVRGWDVLFFAGHSNETELTGGKLAIAPGASLFVQEIEQSLLLAIERGLQFALFNSCNGLSIANTLIDWGLSQVAVMREPIHNDVAQEFLVRFFQSLAQYKDVHESLLAACQYLKLEKHLTYPSAYLIPSLFRHPAAPLFRLKRPESIFKRWIPTKGEAIAFAALACLSWQLPLLGSLLERRVLVQAQYRQLTHQVPTTKQPPVLLVEIDQESLQKAKIPYPAVPMDRSYLAQLVDKLSAIDAKVVGIDYLLDRPQSKKENDQKLAQSLRASLQKNQTNFVFATYRNNAGGWFEVLPELAHPNWSLQGDVRVLGTELRYMTLVPRQETDPQSLPFSYLLALLHRQLNFEGAHRPVQPQLQSSSDWLFQLTDSITKTTGKDHKDIFSPTARLQPVTNFAYPWGQMWLHPIIDYSIPPNQVYQRLPAWQLLEKSADSLKLDPKQQPIVMIAAGGYAEAGASKAGEDNFPLPSAVHFWRSQENPPDERGMFPGGEAHAYMIHHLLNQRLVVPIPDLWLIGVAALLGKGAVLTIEKEKGEKKKGKGKHLLFVFPSGSGKWVVLGGSTAIYGLASLQLYITASVLLPVLMPVATFWTYILLSQLERKSHVSSQLGVTNIARYSANF